MKLLKLFGLPVFLIFSLLMTLQFQSCDPEDDCEDEPECDTCNVVYKPNIYLYPNEQSDLSVRLSFPLGGTIITSIPEYGSGWNVSVSPSGLINNVYPYLFYESNQPDVWQREHGWIIQTTQLESFFRKNMTDYGFNDREVNDFIEYWIPRLNTYPYYSIYPQTKDIIDQVIQLDISKQPDNILRLFYVIKGHNQLQTGITAPAIASFAREGYFVTEWGVVLK